MKWSSGASADILTSARVVLMLSAVNTRILHRVLLGGKDKKSFRLGQSPSLCQQGCSCLRMLRMLLSCRQDQDFGFLAHSFSPPCCLACVTESWSMCSLHIKWRESQVNTRIKSLDWCCLIKCPVKMEVFWSCTVWCVVLRHGWLLSTWNMQRRYF